MPGLGTVSVGPGVLEEAVGAAHRHVDQEVELRFDEKGREC